MALGTVKWYNDSKGYGFITPDEGGEDLLAPVIEIKTPGFRSLFEGQRVSFDIYIGATGKKASNILAIK